jgi:hypothetical protein
MMVDALWFGAKTRSRVPALLTHPETLPADLMVRWACAVAPGAKNTRNFDPM